MIRPNWIVLILLYIIEINSQRFSERNMFKSMNMNRNIRMSLQSSSETLVLFHPYTLRVHDNPCLNAIASLSIPPNKTTLLCIRDHELEQSLGLDISFIDSCVDDVQNTLNGNLIVLQGHTSSTLLSYIQSQKLETNQISVIFCDHFVEPFASIIKNLKKTLQNNNIPMNIVTDHLSNKFKMDQDRIFSKHHFFYHYKRNIPTPRMEYRFLHNILRNDIEKTKTSTATNVLSGESRSLQLIKEYIELGDRLFSLRYYQEYVKTISTSEELDISLCRLITPTAAASSSSTTTTSTISSYQTIKSSYFEGEVFSGIMAPYLTVGCLSPRLLYRARSVLFRGIRGITIEKPLHCRLKNEAIRRDWHSNLAKVSSSTIQNNQGHILFRYWKGYIQREYWSIHHNNLNKPNIIFVHGFGGSINQFTDIMTELSNDFNCYALDSLGFGYSEKPPLSYNQYLWRDQIYDFIKNIAKITGNKKFYISGNSIGGFSSAAVAANMATNREDIEICGLILMNSAGQLYSPQEYQQNISLRLMNSNNSSSSNNNINITTFFPPYTGPAPHVLQFIGKIIFSLLQPNIKRTCEWLYPTNPTKVNKGLVQSIYRDSCDMGASDVIASGAKLPPPRSMNDLLHTYTGPVFISQGILDPLNDAKSRAYSYEKIRNDITIDLLELGHCPMDENPKMVANSILKWINSRKSKAIKLVSQPTLVINSQ